METRCRTKRDNRNAKRFIIQLYEDCTRSNIPASWYDHFQLEQILSHCDIFDAYSFPRDNSSVLHCPTISTNQNALYSQSNMQSNTNASKMHTMVQAKSENLRNIIYANNFLEKDLLSGQGYEGRKNLGPAPRNSERGSVCQIPFSRMSRCIFPNRQSTLKQQQ